MDSGIKSSLRYILPHYVERAGFKRTVSRKARIQRNHIGCALLVWVRLKALAIANKTNVYQLKHGLLDDYLIQQLKNPSLEMLLA